MEKFKQTMKRTLAMFMVAIMMLCAAPLDGLVGLDIENPFELTASAEGNDIVSISVADIQIAEGSNGNWEYDGYWEDDEYFEEAWFCYDVTPSEITVNYEDNTSRTYYYDDEWFDDFSEETSLYYAYYSDQSYTNQWGLGEHTATFEADDFTCEYTVKITESPIESIEVGKLTIEEGTNGWLSWIYDENDNWTGETWFEYSVRPEVLTVNYKDNTSQTYYWSENYFDDFVADTGLEYNYYSDEQVSSNRWGIGEHTATFTAGNFSCEYIVEVVETSIESITVGKVTAVEGMDGWINKIYDDDDEWIGETWIEYDASPDVITINYKNDTSKTYRYEDAYFDDLSEDTGLEWSVYYDQSETNQWGVGKHTATLVTGILTSDYVVEITESPIKNISVSGISITEKTDGNYAGYYNEYDEHKLWFDYNAAPSHIVVNYKNGTSVTCNYYDLYNKTGLDSICYSTQSESNPWRAGKYTARFFAGVWGAEYSVEIKPFDESKIARITAGQTIEVDTFDKKLNYVKFIPEYTGTYTFKSDSDSDPYCRLLDSKLENELAYCDDEIGLNFEFVCNLEAGKTYYCALSNYDNSGKVKVTVTLDEITGCRHLLSAKDYPQTNATCTTDGYTAGKYCSLCKTWFEGHEVIKATGHNSNVTIPAVAATCTKTGLTAGKKCSGCGIITVAQNAVAKTAHKEVTIPAVAATYTAEGKTAGKKCSVCNAVTVAQTPVAKLTLSKVSGLKAKTVKVAKSSEVTLSWNKIGDGVKYEVYQQNGKKWKKIKTTTKTSYTVKKLKSNKSYKFRVRAVVDDIKGKYSSTLTVKTVPAKTTLTLKASKKQLTASWKSVSSISGYEVQYSTSKSMKNAKTVKVKKDSKKTTIKKLKKGKKYYVRVRSYKTVNDKKIYSSWSTVKNVKVK